MSTSRAIDAIRSMRKAADDGNLQEAHLWSSIFLAESMAAEVGREIAERQGRRPHDPRQFEEEQEDYAQ